MTQENKQLLLQDLCARLPYGVIGVTSEGNQTPLLVKGEADWDILTSLNYRIEKFGWKPYLRPMSSMTEEEKDEYSKAIESLLWTNELDFFNKYHLDYRGLIPKGLALEAPEDMYSKQ